MSKPSFVYVTYIASTPEKVFAALTDAAMSEQYWHGTSVISDWKVGSPVTLRLKHQTKHITGVVLEADPPRRLVYSFQPHHGDMAGEEPSRVLFEIEPQKDQVKLTVVHDGFAAGSKVFEGISRGWPLILLSLKSFIESGRVLYPDWYSENAATEQGSAS